MIEELGAEFSPNTKLSQEADAKLEIVQGELIYPGYEYEQILQYLQQKNILPPKVFRALSMSISAFLALKKEWDLNQWFHNQISILPIYSENNLIA